MFKRVIHEQWMEFIPMIAFGLLFAVFIIATIRALRIQPKERDRLASLPIENDSNRPL
ncbi:MAG: hypothetical protein MUF31_18770 [Akkermansiaceae bacterium]|jgi:hypothetical protein|nr:hypothetical protein [Akkermansiaceae bacterium]